MKVKPIFEFLMWENCKNNCKFCFQTNKNQLDLSHKIDSMNKVIEFLDSSGFIKGSHILLVGGEIFDSPEIFVHLDSFLNIIINKIKSNDIDKLYINTNLLYNNLAGLESFLENIVSENLVDHLKFTTSYDLAGRFLSKAREELMLKNLEYIKNKYNINIVVNSMLSNKLCESILDGSFSVKEFSEKYNVYINLIPYIVKDPSLRANKSDIFKALIKVNNEIPNYLEGYINNFLLNQPRKLYQYQDGKLIYVSSDDSLCGHSVNFKMYSESGSCFICDLEALRNTLGFE